jgi:hypothetical protein
MRINELKSVCCFDFNERENLFKQTIEFKINDNLDNCKIAPCQYFTLSPETAQTILNTPWGTEPFPFSMDVLKTTDNANSIIQIISADGEWRRRLFKNSLETWWGKWVNIEKLVNDILNNEGMQKFLAENWDRYMEIDKDYPSKRKWKGGKVAIDEIVNQIKTGTVKAYRNKLV